jgi:uncharacterized protein
MNYLKITVFYLSVIFMVSNASADDVKAALAIEYLELTKTSQIFDVTIDSYVGQLSAKQPQLDQEKLRMFFESNMGWSVLKDPTIKIVSESFSESELKNINAFFKTESGKILANKSLGISTEISKLISQNINKAFSEIQRNSGH